MGYTIRCRTCEKQHEYECRLADLPDRCPRCRGLSTPDPEPDTRVPHMPATLELGSPDAVPWRGQDASGLLGVRFRVDGVPAPQPRPRIGSIPIGRKCPSCGVAPTRPQMREADHGHRIFRWKDNVRVAWRTVQPEPGWRFGGPVSVAILCVIERPVGKPKKGHQRPPGRFIPTVGSVINGDLDNYAKAILDALNGHAWQDDAQIGQLTVAKWAAAAGEDPHAIVEIVELPTHAPGAHPGARLF